jgi:Uma2 family endonuclease
MTARTATRPAPPPAFGALDYPSSDGEPAAETDWHRHLLFESTTRLAHRYAADPNVYVSGNLLVYYQEGDTQLCLAPDCFVVFGVEKGGRETFKTWVEQAYPAVVFEFTSQSTRERDTGVKFATYQDVWKVDEYFLFDPFEEYLTPSLIGYRRDANGDLLPITPSADGSVLSERLRLTILRDGKSLAFRDPTKGKLLLNADEDRARIATDRRKEAEARAGEAEARLADALAELARLRKSP